MPKLQTTNYKPITTAKQSGFTLVELSIVIVIIGLIVAGVTGGQSLVKSAKLRTISADSNKYITAINAFKMEYNSLPGDLDKASQYWSGANDGNGDKKVDGQTEAYFLWHHLMLAGLIDGAYDGTNGGSSEAPGVNVASSGWSSDSGFYAWSMGTISLFGNIIYAGNHVYQKRNLKLFGFGKVRHDNNHQVSFSALSPQEASSIDDKIDDGEPHLGKIMADGGGEARHNCTNLAKFAKLYVTSDGDVDYDLTTSTDAECRLYIQW